MIRYYFIKSSIIIFFFQAEDDIRYGHVTGVQTCALPIYHLAGPVARLSTTHNESTTPIRKHHETANPTDFTARHSGIGGGVCPYCLPKNRTSGILNLLRSEERRVGKECKCYNSR